MVLSHGGQVIGTSTALARDLPPLTEAAQAADAIRSAAGPRPRVGVPFAFSTHALLMGRWLGRGIEIRTVPPPLMAEALARGDGAAFGTALAARVAPPRAKPVARPAASAAEPEPAPPLDPLEALRRRFS